MKSLALALLLALPALAAPEATSKSAPGPPQRCGGNIAHPRTCPKGQFCAHPDGNPDREGLCVGQRCGGFSPSPRKCPTGEVCVDIHPNIADEPGVCAIPQMTCGGIAGKRCKDGWGCYPNPDQHACKYVTDPDCVGICVPPVPE